MTVKELCVGDSISNISRHVRIKSDDSKKKNESTLSGHDSNSHY